MAYISYSGSNWGLWFRVLGRPKPALGFKSGSLVGAERLQIDRGVLSPNHHDPVPICVLANEDAEAFQLIRVGVFVPKP